MGRLYHYVGADELRRQVANAPVGALVKTYDELAAWLHNAQPRLRALDDITATFVVDAQGALLLADRRSEHVACAGGAAVQSAGEIVFAFGPAGWEARDVSNQSTGYCPEASSWPAVAAALTLLGIPFPPGFTDEFTFRRCPKCAELTIVKEGEYVCAVCGAELPFEWNLDKELPADNS